MNIVNADCITTRLPAIHTENKSLIHIQAALRCYYYDDDDDDDEGDVLTNQIHGIRYITFNLFLMVFCHSNVELY